MTTTLFLAPKLILNVRRGAIFIDWSIKMINQDINHEIRRILIASFVVARELPKSYTGAAIYQYDFDNATSVMDTFKSLTTAAIRAKLNAKPSNN